MDEPNGGQITADNTNGGDPGIVPSQPGSSLHPEHPLPPNRHIELVIAAAVLIFVVLQYFMARANNHSTSDQVGKIITAANGISASASSFSQSASSIKSYAKQFSDSAAKIDTGIGNAVGKLQDQVNQIKRSAADAANSSATTAKDALHISERAHLTVGGPILEGENRTFIRLPIINDGHIDAVQAITTVIEETVSLTKHTKIEGHWTRLHTGDVAPYNAGLTTSGFTDADKIDPKGIGGAEQRVFVLGFIKYNDGFPGTPDQTVYFCYEAVPSFDKKDAQFIFCDAPTMIPLIEKEINYPNNYEEPSLFQ